MKLNEVPIGTKLELETLRADGVEPEHILVSKFEWAVDENIAMIAAPINEGVVFPIHTGTEMNIYFLMKREGETERFCFKAVVVGRGTVESFPVLKIEATGEIERIQRRQYYRLPCSVPVMYRVVDTTDSMANETVPFKKSLVSNLSGGGIRLLLEDKVEDGKLIECELMAGKGVIIKFFGEVMRYEKTGTGGRYKYEAGITYIKINEKDREAVVKFIFDEQRKLRKKGLI